MEKISKAVKNYLNIVFCWLYFRTLTTEGLASQIKDKTQRDAIRREVIGEVVVLWERDMTGVGLLAQDFADVSHFKAGVLALVVPLDDGKRREEPEVEDIGKRVKSGSMKI